ncbi:hypothetical protein KIPB_012479, partial [Kipferlia bialata]|eukprot:g12479.t1
MAIPMLLLSLIPTLKGLSVISFCAILASCFAVLFVFGTFIARLFEGALNPVYFPSDYGQGLGEAFPLLSTAFGGEFMVVLLFSNLQGSPKAKQSQIHLVIKYTLLFTWALNAIMGVSGAAMFGNDTLDNILLNFPQ